MSSSASPPRFRIRLEDGSEIAVSSVEALARRVGRGDLLPDTPLLDASIGGWRRAGDVAVVRFLIEEIVRELGDYPDGWSEAAISGSPAVDARSGEPRARGHIDLSGFTIVDEAESGPPTSPPPLALKKDRPSDTKRFDFTIAELPNDAETYPPPPPSSELVTAVEPDEDWLQAGLGADIGERTAVAPSTASDWGGFDDAPAPASEAPSVPRSRRAERSLGKFIPILAVGAVIVGGLWFWSDRVERSVSYLVDAGRLQRPARVINTSLPFIEIPEPAPPPPGLESEVASAVDNFAGEIRRIFTAMRQDAGLTSTPPAAWLTGYYMANASEFGSVPAFWEGYRSLVEELHQREEGVFLALLVEEAGRLEPMNSNRSVELHDYLLARWETALPARDALYANLALTADSAIELHEFLVSNQSSLRYTPAVGSEVPRDPVLEVETLDPSVDSGLKARLDRVLMALDRSRTDRVSVMEGIEAALFSAVERF